MLTRHSTHARRPGVTPVRCGRSLRSGDARLWLERLEERVLLSAGDSFAEAIGLSFDPSGTSQISSETLVDPGDVKFFQIVLTEPGNLAAHADAAGQSGSFTLYDNHERPIVRSDGRSATDLSPSLVHGLLGSGENGGTIYYLKVANRETDESIQLVTSFTPSSSDLHTIPTGVQSIAIVRGDFNDDGQLDLATANADTNDVTVLLGNGDGTFQIAGSFDCGTQPQALITAKFNGDDWLDLVIANDGTNGVRVMLGNGDGSFQSALIVAEEGGDSLASGDFDGDGLLDLAVAKLTADRANILLGNGDGFFQPAIFVSIPGGPAALVTGHFNGDTLLDLAAAIVGTSQVTVLRGQGNGEFLTGDSFDVGTDPVALVAGDFNGDTQLDLATANVGTNDVTVLLSQGSGTFSTVGSFPAGNQPESLVTGDFDGDGQLDLASANAVSDDVTLLLNRGAVTFHSAGSVPVGANPRALTAGDFNGDGNLDFATANYYARDVDVLLGIGAGRFPNTSSPNKTGEQPLASALGDFNGDGRLDLATANYASADVTVLLGQGDGTFQQTSAAPVGGGPVELIAGDFNGDGRLDLATANYYSGDVTVLLGQGDGTLLNVGTYAVEGTPSALAVGDFIADNHLDLAVTIKFDADFNFGTHVVLLQGDGQGAFALVPGDRITEEPFAVGTQPVALLAGDFNGDTHLDLAVANYYSGDLTVLLGDGEGSFQEAGLYPLSASPYGLVMGDFDGDTDIDLAVATRIYDGVTILLNQGDGTFEVLTPIGPTTQITSLSTGDFNGDGVLDLAAASDVESSTYEPVNAVMIFLGNGDGTFVDAASVAAGKLPNSVVAGDFNGDGRLDLATTDTGTSTVTALMGTGTGSFLSPHLSPAPVQSTPIVGNLFNGAVLDTMVLTQTGLILLRRGLPDQPGTFAPPVVLNPDPALAARDLALVRTADGATLLAALEADGPRVTLYQPNLDGTFTIVPLDELNLPAGFLPAHLASADLTGDGLGDLIITAAASHQVFVSLQTDPGIFAEAVAYTVGVNPSTIAFAKVDADDYLDIVITNRFSGQLSILLNDAGTGSFFPEERYRAGAGLYALTPIDGTPTVHSLEGTNGVVAGTFDDRDGVDLIVANYGANSFTLLSGTDGGGFLNPQATRTVLTGGPPSALVAGRFISDDVHLHLAVLSEETGALEIYRGDGNGAFTLHFTASAGNQPTGFSVADVSQPDGGAADGIPDLLVGNAFGDLLILAGNGDGTFSQYRRAGQAMSLAVANAPGAGPNTFFFSDQGSDQLAYKSAESGARTVADADVFQGRNEGIQAPGSQAVVTVRGIQYLVVANSGANNLLIYTIGPDGRPDLGTRQTYFTGTGPTGLTVTNRGNDLNRDSIPDLVVANEGSNDVSVFLGAITNGVWKLAYRPRQDSAGSGPTSVVVADLTGADGTGAPDGIPDLLVSNAQSSSVNLLPSRGDGFFIRQPTATAFALRTAFVPGELFVGNFDRTRGLDLVTLNGGSGGVTLITNFLTNPVASTFGFEGAFPVAALLLDMDANGVNELLVANSNGALEMLEAGFGGFEATEITLLTPMASLSDLVLVRSGNDFDVYGTEAGQEVASLLASFSTPQVPSTFFPPSPGFTVGVEIFAELPSIVDADVGATPSSVVTADKTQLDLAATAQDFTNNGILGAFFNTGESESKEPDPQADTPGPPPVSDSPSGILLHNLTDPEEGPREMLRPELPEDEPPDDEPTGTLDSTALLALAPEETMPPISLTPVPVRTASAQAVIVLQPQAPSDGVTPTEEEPSPAAIQCGTKGKSVQWMAAITSFWYAFPLMASHWLKPLKRRLSVLLRRE